MLWFLTLIFLLISIFLAWLSRASLASPKQHGFYRFFAWEAILAVVLMNIPHWLDEPFSLPQLGSWALLLLSIILVLDAVRLLRRTGAPDNSRADPGLLGVEKTTKLVTHGIYGLIRHPMYSSLLCLAWGAFLKSITLPALFLALSASLLLTLTAIREESENLKYWGEAYREYMRCTRRFIPRIY